MRIPCLQLLNRYPRDHSSLCFTSPAFFMMYSAYKLNKQSNNIQPCVHTIYSFGIKIARRNINNLRYADDITLMAESKDELKTLLMKVKEEWKSWLKTQHSKTWDCGIWSRHFMANRWGNNGNSDRLYFLGLQKALQIVTSAMKLKDSCSMKEKLWPT